MRVVIRILLLSFVVSFGILGASDFVQAQFKPQKKAPSITVKIPIKPKKPGGSTPAVSIPGRPSASCAYRYSDWGDCQPNGKQTRTVLSGTCPEKPVVEQKCLFSPCDWCKSHPRSPDYKCWDKDSGNPNASHCSGENKITFIDCRTQKEIIIECPDGSKCVDGACKTGDTVTPTCVENADGTVTALLADCTTVISAPSCNPFGNVSLPVCQYNRTVWASERCPADKFCKDGRCIPLPQGVTVQCEEHGDGSVTSTATGQAVTSRPMCNTNGQRVVYYCDDSSPPHRNTRRENCDDGKICRDGQCITPSGGAVVPTCEELGDGSVRVTIANGQTYFYRPTCNDTATGRFEYY